jgi:hypothetical protein
MIPTQSSFWRSQNLSIGSSRLFVFAVILTLNEVKGKDPDEARPATTVRNLFHTNLQPLPLPVLAGSIA